MMNKQKGFIAQAGFTLVELLLYVTIISAIIFTVIFFLQITLSTRVKNQTISEVEEQGSMVMQLLTQSARNALVINTPAAGGSGSILSLNTTLPATTPTVFDLSAGVIRITEGAGTAVALTNSRVNATNLTFQNLTGTATKGNVRIQFTLNYINQSGRNEYDYSKTFTGDATLR